MKRILTILPCFAMLVSLAQTPSKKLVWSDEFEAAGAPDPSKWDYDLGDGGWGNNELQDYTNDSKNVRVENGKLIIEARHGGAGEKPYTSARIVSRKKGDWLYGRIEIKARIPKGRGTWPAIWMLPTDWKYGGWPESGEIDIMEHVGYDPGVIHFNTHTETYNHVKKTNVDAKTVVAGCQDQFHVYAIDWSKDRIDFLVDDKVVHSHIRKNTDTYKEWPFDQRFHLLMNIAVGGNWGGAKGVDDTIWPQRMEVEYVRVYQ